MRINKKRIVIYCILTIALFTYIFPIYWTVTTSFKTKQDAEFKAVPPVFPFLNFQPTIQSYNELLMSADFPRYFFNSLVVSTVNVLVCIALGIPAGYGLARYRFKRRKDITFYLLSLRMAPAFGFIIPFFLIFRDAGLLDTQLGLILIYLLFNLPFTIWMLNGFIQELPVDLEEAAMVDGCTRLGTIWRVVIPLIRPGIAATAILCFIFSWNEFLFAFVLTRTGARTLPVAIATYVGYLDIQWTKMCAASTLAFAPIVAFFILVQKHVIRGLTLGAVKG